MREIKFRAWVKSEKRYITDTQDFIPLIVTNKGVMKLQSQFKENYYEILPFDWFVLEQFTGLHDKNGIEIYEGDIVKTYEPFNIPQVAEVRFNDGCFDVVGITLTFRDYLKCFVVNHAIEVIGNIHERS